MTRRLPLLLLLAAAAWAANVKLYLKEGGFHLVREYEVQTDRVRFYSVERSQWEEMPLDLVDLKRTEAEAAARKAELEKESKALADEEKVHYEIRRETSRIPQEPGVYWLDGQETRVLKQAESSVHSSKGRAVLQRISPIPNVTGHATLEIKGAHSETAFSNPSQEFYIQLSEPERFGIVKVTSSAGVRIVENVTTEQATKIVTEDADLMPILRQQLDEDMYKIWPRDPLPPGEYAVVEYTEGKVNMQIWDFAIKGK
jgi:hypothetical protein